MAGYGTMKPSGQEAVQLTFPAVFSQQYVADGTQSRYLGSAGMPTVQPVAGTDFQAHYHQQKKRDADYMARAKVIATQNMKTRAFSSHQGYFGMPAPVLSQRKFANPSYGMAIVSSARRDGSVDAPWSTVQTSSGGGVLSGGVLRSAEGQAFGKSRLLDRVRQLNAIEVAKQAFKGELPPEAGMGPQIESLDKFNEYKPIGTDEDIELSQLLQQISDVIVKGDYKQLSDPAIYQTSIRALQLLFRWSIGASPEDYEDKLAAVDTIVRNLDDLLDPDRVDMVLGQSDDPDRFVAVMDSTSRLFDNVREYLEQMIGFINAETRSVEQKKAKSRALVRELGFNRIIARPIDLPDAFADEQSRALREDFDDGPDDGRFDRPAVGREDGEAAQREDDDFEADERQAFGYQSGAFFGEAPSEAGESENPFSRGRRVAEEDLLRRGERAPPPSVAGPPSEPSLRRVARDDVTGLPSVESERPAPERRTRKLRRPAAEAVRVAREDLPRTREGLVELVARINAAGGVKEDGAIGQGGKPIRIYSSSTVPNIKKNLIRRLKL